MGAETRKKKITPRDIAALQGIVVIYTCSSVFAKIASGQAQLAGMALFAALEFVVLGVYAVLWQQAIKKFDLSVAYANRAMVLFWSMIWAVLLFREAVTATNIVGVALVVLGTFVINTEKRESHAG